MWPAPQERPEPFHGLPMDFTKAVAIVITCDRAPPFGPKATVPAPAACLARNALFRLDIHPPAG
jgi:hypothetical protein